MDSYWWRQSGLPWHWRRRHSNRFVSGHCKGIYKSDDKNQIITKKHRKPKYIDLRCFWVIVVSLKDILRLVQIIYNQFTYLEPG